MGAAAPVKGNARRPGISVAVATAGLFALACYINTISNQFVFDDIDIIVRNPLVTSPGIDLPGIFTSHYWQHLTPTGDLYRPLVILTYALNHSLGGLEPAGYHLVNLLLHALCTGLVVLLGRRFGLSTPASLAAGILFAAHPIHTEAVAGVVGRAELMAAGSVLAAWSLHLGSSGATSAGTLAVSGLLLAGLLSKENAAVLPALMIAGDLWRVRRSEITWRRTLPVYLACGIVILLWLMFRAALLAPPSAGSGYEGPFEYVAAPIRILTALAVMGRYLALLVLPVTLSADYSFEQIPMVNSWTDPLACVSAAVLITLALAALRGLVKGRGPALPALWIAFFLIAMLPVSNLLLPIGTIMGERLLYLPSVGFCLLLPSLWSSLAGSASPPGPVRHLGAVLVCTLSLFYAARTVIRNADWRDQLTLFSATTISSPASAKAHYNLGVALDDAARPDEALRAYLTAIRIKPLDAKSHLNAGLLLAKSDRTAEAFTHLEEASRIDGTLPHVYTSLGAALSRLGRDEEAATAFMAALKADPDDAMAHYNLGTLRLIMGNPGDAIQHLERARDLNPAEPDGRYQLGLAYLQAGRARDSVTEMRVALERSPDLAMAHVQLALAYMRLGMLHEAAIESELASKAGLPLPPELEPLRRVDRVE